MSADEISTLRTLYDNQFGDIAELLDGLPDAALLWKPFEGDGWNGPAGALGPTIGHALSSTVWLLRRGLWAAQRIEWEQVKGDEGGPEFEPPNQDVAYLRARAARAHALVQELLGHYDADTLAASRPNPRRPGVTVGAHYDLLHALDHLSRHIGEAMLTRQLWAVHQAQATSSSSSES